MQTIKVNNKTFRLSMPEHEIKDHVKAVAVKIDKEYAGRNPIFVVILKGAFIYAADLLRALTIECEVEFVKLSSYDGTQSTGQVVHQLGLTRDIDGRDIIVVEDIVETGNTLASFIPELMEKKAASVAITALFHKPSCLKADIKVDYPAMVIPDDFIVGYGLDYNQCGRELKDIYTITE